MKPGFRASLSIAAGVLALTSAIAASSALADVQAAVPAVQMRAVDARNGQLIVDYATDGADGSAVKVLVDGQQVAGTVTPLRDAGVESSAMVVVDTSAAATNASAQLALEDLTDLEVGKGSLKHLGVVSTADSSGNAARLRASLSDSSEALKGPLSSISTGGKSYVWDAVAIAAKELSAKNLDQPNIVIVTSAADAGSKTSFSSAERLVLDIHATVHVIAFGPSAAASPELRQLVADAGGSIQTGSDREFKQMFAAARTVTDHQYRFKVDSFDSGKATFRSIEVQVGSAATTGSFRPNGLSAGAQSLTYVAPREEAGGLFAESWVKFAIAGLAALAITGVVVGGVNLMMKRRDSLDYALRHYDDSHTDDTQADSGALASAAIVQRGVAATQELAQRHGLLSSVESMLERADLPLRAAEALFFYTIIVVLSIILAFFLTGSIVIAAIVAVMAGVFPRMAVAILVKRRFSKFQAQLPEMLHLMAGTLRAGYSIAQGFEAISSEIDDPMGKELRKALSETSLGRPLDEALEAMGKRVGSEDFEWTVMAIRIQREVGGNLAELLMTVADTMIQRERLRRDVKTLTAEGRMSAIILGGLPPALGLVMYVLNGEYMSKLFSGFGLWILGAAAVCMLLGFYFMKKCIEIEI